MNPLVSVIVPNYNHSRYLRERLDSILAQTMRDFELILLDDASTDNSLDILREYQAMDPRVSHLVANPDNTGSPFAQWKRGLQLARGKYVWIAESDDFATPMFLESLVALLEADPAAVMAFSGSAMVGRSSRQIRGMDWDRYPKGAADIETYTPEQTLRCKLLWTANIYNASMVLFRRESAPEIEPSQLKMRYCGDWLFWVNLASRGNAVELRRKLNRFRQHPDKVSPSASREGLYFLEGVPVMVRVADMLQCTPRQRLMLAGRTLKRLRKFPELLQSRSRRREVEAHIERLCPGATAHPTKAIIWYEIDKYFNFTHLQPRP